MSKNKGSCVVRCAATKFKFKSPSMHSVICGHPTTKSEFCQAEIRQVQGLTVVSLISMHDVVETKIE
ncbi:hypothetical protein E2C01_016257 [Portunus trituberculatus]|uniref:Uncharacterized protein n=1 Tax=Portunus trituberculatus TaxID=210409 RepID=A0A5B7DPS6_PORTR|nr:hypothetical protein [Portunus trituberculatus]